MIGGRVDRGCGTTGAGMIMAGVEDTRMVCTPRYDLRHGANLRFQFGFGKLSFFLLFAHFSFFYRGMSYVILVRFLSYFVLFLFCFYGFSFGFSLVSFISLFVHISSCHFQVWEGASLGTISPPKLSSTQKMNTATQSSSHSCGLSTTEG